VRAHPGRSMVHGPFDAAASHTRRRTGRIGRNHCLTVGTGGRPGTCRKATTRRPARADPQRAAAGATIAVFEITSTQFLIHIGPFRPQSTKNGRNRPTWFSRSPPVDGARGRDTAGRRHAAGIHSGGASGIWVGP
jgi:hypothetical protein